MSESEKILENLEKTSSGNNDSKAIRFILNSLSSTPYVGGIFAASSALWSEKEQNTFNKRVVEFSKITDERVDNLEKSIVDIHNPTHVVVGFVVFTPGYPYQIIDSSGIMSVTWSGTYNFEINFISELNRYIFNCYGGGEVVIKNLIEHPKGIKVTLGRPCPDRVTFVFYELRSHKN